MVLMFKIGRMIQCKERGNVSHCSALSCPMLLVVIKVIEMD